jgi:hypothetical protein
MIAIRRVTIEYDEAEDRIRIIGERAGLSNYGAWLTQRLSSRLLANLFKMVAPADDLGLSAIMNEFAQERAEAEFEPQRPVKAPKSDDECSLIQTIDIRTHENAVQIIFHGGSGEAASLTLSHQELRQWLSIMRRTYQRAEWPMEFWPPWLTERPGLEKTDRLMN